MILHRRALAATSKILGTGHQIDFDMAGTSFGTPAAVTGLHLHLPPPTGFGD
jgi:hypothetical protein